MAAKLIGFIDCPICAFHGVALKEDKKGKATFYADCCGFQGQSRDDKADKSLRSKVFSNAENTGIKTKAREPMQDDLGAPRKKTFAEEMGL